LLLAVLGTVLLQLGVIYIPSLNKFFHTEPLTLVEMLAAFGISSLTFFVVELEKKVKRIVKLSGRRIRH
jgi:Ca2+-transporting ATPase